MWLENLIIGKLYRNRNLVAWIFLFEEKESYIYFYTVLHSRILKMKTRKIHLVLTVYSFILFCLIEAFHLKLHFAESLLLKVFLGSPEPDLRYFCEVLEMLRHNFTC